jgi:glycosyltransferase involved in cell wall biosynthesis
MKMCQAFANAGHEVILLAPDRKDDRLKGIDDVFAHYDVSRNFRIVRLPWLNMKGKGYIYGLMSALWCKKNNPELVFGRNLVACAISTGLRMDVIYESHSPDDERGRIERILFKSLTRSAYAKKLVVITESLKEYYKSKYSLLHKKITVAADGADPMDSEVAAVDLKRDKSRMQVGYVGHLYEGKGIEIVSELASQCQQYDFHVVGGREPEIDVWKSKTRSLNNLTFHGYVSHERVPGYIKAFDVVLLPNQPVVRVTAKDDIGKWTSPLKMFEYMSAGKPIIASDIDVLKEILKDRVNALLCSHEDINGWVRALEELESDKQLAVSISMNAKNDLLRKYTWQSRAENILSK